MNPIELILFGIKEIPTVDDDRLSQRGLDPREIGMAILVPVGHDDEGVGPFERLVVRFGVTNRVADLAPAFL